MATPGRPCVLDDKKRTIILALLKSGCSRTTAAISVGCHPKTILNTAKRDPEFAERLAMAENVAEFIHLENINKAGKEMKYWRASAWMLERIDPDRFGKSDPDAITPAQLTSLIVQIAQIIIQEIPVPELREQIIKRFDCLLVEARLVKGPIPTTPEPFSLLELEQPQTLPEPQDNASD
jgi:hypothetical protein